MIIQGSNNPIIFTFPDDMSNIKDIEIALFGFNILDAETASPSVKCPCPTPAEEPIELKHWTKSDIQIEEKVITAPLTQEETTIFPCGKCIIEIKWLDEGGQTNFAKKISSKIVDRYDKTIMEG